MKQKKRGGFTMIELVFVIVVLGILAAVAIPKFAATREDAQISAGRATVAAVRSAIVNERQKSLLQGNSLYVPSLGSQFSGVLAYPAKKWSGNGPTYTYKVGTSTCTFTYYSSNGIFVGTSLPGDCAKLDF
jgi:general secretion pathway protein G